MTGKGHAKTEAELGGTAQDAEARQEHQEREEAGRGLPENFRRTGGLNDT